MWWVWSLPLLSGIADASARGVIKLTKVHRLTLIAAGYLFALPFYLVWLVLEGAPRVYPIFWLAVGFHIPLLLLANIMTVEAHRSSPLILTAPYLSLTPAFLLITAPLMGGGSPTWLGGAGVLVITFGLYILNSQNGYGGWLKPFKNLAKERGSRLMLAVAFIFAFILKRPDFQSEKENLWQRVSGVLLMVIGMVVIILYGRA